jgi:ActR/RegA family two-component response regulator
MTVNKFLFIDDDRSLLNTLERNLSLDFDLCVAEGGQAALALLESAGPFSVVTVDMRMPGMDGIQTIKAAREIAPETVYMMLTGNQDMTTAMQAVNDGQVFRFLNKPCEIGEIKKALTAAQRQYELIVAEKELLHETFVGSIGFMSDIIELQSTNLIDSDRLANTLAHLAKKLDIEIGWEERIAARIALVGLALLSQDERENLQKLDISEPEHSSALAKMCQISARMIERIPRLGRIAKILRMVPKVDGWVSATHPTDYVTASAFRVAMYWSMLTQKGLSANTALQEIKLAMPRLCESFSKSIGTLDDYTDACVPVLVAIEQLVEGMVMFEDVMNEDGAIIVSRGRKLTMPIIEKLTRFCGDTSATVKIVAGSCPQFAAENCEPVLC